MTSLVRGKIKPKTSAEILAKLRETIHRHRKKFVRQQLLSRPENCVGAQVAPDGSLLPCAFCGARPGEACKRASAFQPRHSRAELHALFKADVNNPQKLIRDYRDVAFLLWALGLLDGDRLVGPTPTNVADAGDQEPSTSGPEAQSRLVWFELPTGVAPEAFQVFLSALTGLLPMGDPHGHD